MAAADPTGLIWGDAAGGNQAVQVRMRTHLLVPGVQHRQEADLGSDPARIGGQGEQGFGGCLEEHAIHHAGILKGQPRKLVWQREGDRRVGNRQQFLGCFCKPFFASRGLALGTSAMAAGLEREVLVGTMVTLLEAGAQSGGLACADVPERLALVGRERIAPPRQELLLVLTKDLGDFQPRWHQRGRPSSSELSRGLSRSASNGLRIACSRCSDTRR